MGQFSIKNDRAVALLEELTRLTGQGKTETVLEALELYRASLLADRRTSAVVDAIHDRIHPYLDPAWRGRAPTKDEIEAELGMP